jgi:hypothetical protein
VESFENTFEDKMSNKLLQNKATNSLFIAQFVPANSQKLRIYPNISQNMGSKFGQLKSKFGEARLKTTVSF